MLVSPNYHSRVIGAMLASYACLLCRDGCVYPFKSDSRGWYNRHVPVPTVFASYTATPRAIFILYFSDSDVYDRVRVMNTARTLQAVSRSCKILCYETC